MKTITFIAILMLLSSCGLSRIETMNPETGEFLTVVDHKELTKVGDTLLIKTTNYKGPRLFGIYQKTIPKTKIFLNKDSVEYVTNYNVVVRIR